MEKWTKQAGYPVVYVTVDHNTGNVKLTQVYTT